MERIALREAVDQLPEKERMTILLRYFKGLTQERAARVLGVSQVQVSRWNAGDWNGCGRALRSEIGIILKFRHGGPITLWHVGHS